jgi:hypothetical protein
MLASLSDVTASWHRATLTYRRVRGEAGSVLMVRSCGRVVCAQERPPTRPPTARRRRMPRARPWTAALGSARLGSDGRGLHRVGRGVAEAAQRPDARGQSPPCGSAGSQGHDRCGGRGSEDGRHHRAQVPKYQVPLGRDVRGSAVRAGMGGGSLKTKCRDGPLLAFAATSAATCRSRCCPACTAQCATPSREARRDPMRTRCLPAAGACTCRSPLCTRASWPSATR